VTGARVSLRSAKTAFNVDAAFKALAHLVREDREQRRAAEAASAPQVRARQGLPCCCYSGKMWLVLVLKLMFYIRRLQSEDEKQEGQGNGQRHGCKAQRGAPLEELQHLVVYILLW
jgi:hypothetical protein